MFPAVYSVGRFSSPLTRRLTRPVAVPLGDQVAIYGGGFSPLSLFASGEKGLIWDFSRSDTLFQDAGVTPGAIDAVIGRVTDLSPNGVAGNQTTSAQKPLWSFSGGRYSALFDGTDDNLATDAIDLTGVNEVTVIAGVRKLADGGTRVVAELSASFTTNAGTFYLLAPEAASATYRFGSRGSAAGAVASASGFAAPHTAVLTGQADISADTISLRVNGAQVASAATDQGTGNYGNHALYVGARAGTSLRFNGHIHALVIVGRALTATELVLAEYWANSRTGAF